MLSVGIKQLLNLELPAALIPGASIVARTPGNESQPKILSRDRKFGLDLHGKRNE